MLLEVIAYKMVKAGYDWQDRTTIGHIRHHMADGMTYDEGWDSYNTDEDIGSMMQKLFDEVHTAATEKYTSYEYTWLAHEMPTEYTIDQVAELCVGCFIGCKITTEEQHCYIYCPGKPDTAKRLVSCTLTINWEDEESDLEKDEKAWQKCKDLQDHYRRKDRDD